MQFQQLTNQQISDNLNLVQMQGQCENNLSHSSSCHPSENKSLKKRGRPATGWKVLLCPYEGCHGKKFRDLFNLWSHLKTHVSFKLSLDSRLTFWMYFVWEKIHDWSPFESALAKSLRSQVFSLHRNRL